MKLDGQLDLRETAKGLDAGKPHFIIYQSSNALMGFYCLD
jgi:hypothetical protein